MSAARKGPISKFWAGTLEAKLAASQNDAERYRRERDAKAAQVIALRQSISKLTASARRERDRLRAQVVKATTLNTGGTMSSGFPSTLSPEANAEGRYYGFYRDHRIEVGTVICDGDDCFSFIAYVDGQRIVGIYSSRNLAELQAKIEIDALVDALEPCEAV